MGSVNSGPGKLGRPGRMFSDEQSDTIVHYQLRANIVWLRSGDRVLAKRG